jgi:hypothetical protein
MRHVPEDELHAYLDQALSRSQCVEIETHLSECAHCRRGRDGIAALRDRTTALLATLTPRALIVPPPFQALIERRSRDVLRSVWERRVRRAGLWAAAIAAAVGAGWGARAAFDPHRNPPPVVASSVVTPIAVSPRDDIEPRPKAIPIPIPAHEPARTLAARSTDRSVTRLVPAPAFQQASLTIPSHDLVSSAAHRASEVPPDIHSPTDRIWRVISWEEALQLAGSGLPYLEGLPVLGVLVQPGASGERPTVIVAQQDPGGDVIQSIEGPVGRVTELLQRQAAPDVHASEPARTPPDYVDGPGGVRRGLRIMAVTGRLAVDSLNVLARGATIR